MKIVIEITEAQVSGLKEYLKDTDGNATAKIGKRDIQQEIQGIVDGNLQIGSVYDYISKYE